MSGGAGPLTPPEKLRPGHDLSGFDCGEASLDDWLRRRALPNTESGASRTYVVCSGPMRVVAYYALAAGAVAHLEAPGRVKRNMPDPIPVMVLARLAVDRSYQGRGLGASLPRDAIVRTLQAAEIAGIRAMLVDAISDRARRFYESAGFAPSPVDPSMLFITMAEAAKAVVEGDR